MGTSRCQSRHSQTRPPVPYGEQENTNNTLFYEDGYKEVVGYLTEGRYLVFNKNSYALRSDSNKWSLDTSKPGHLYNRKENRWILHYTEDEESEIFTLENALDGRWLGPRAELYAPEARSSASQIRITFLGNGLGHTLQYARSGEYLDIDHLGNLVLHDSDGGLDQGFLVVSVTYHD